MSSASEASEQANRSGMDPLRLVVIFYLLSTLVLGMFFAHVFAVLWARFGWPNQILVSGPDWDVPSAVGIVLALGLGIFCYVNKKVRGRTLESASELMKVTWPSWHEVRTSTVAVVIASLVASVILFGIDRISYEIMVDWLPRLWGKL